MTCYLVLCIRFLDDRFHGQTDNGEKAEWPPSPFRLFQAIVAGNARGPALPNSIISALQWLETLDPPVIIAPRATEGLERLTYVINNYSHKNRQSRAPKTIRPTILNGDRLLEYFWSFDPNSAGALTSAETIIGAVKHVRCLGWGIDMAIGNGSLADAPPASTSSRIVFRPTRSVIEKGIALRTPTADSFLSLERTYSDFIARYDVPGVTRMEASPLFEPVIYVSNPSRPHLVFKLLDDNEDPLRYPHAKLIHIAGMVRHLAIDAMRREIGARPWITDDWVKRAVRGKRSESAEVDHGQFSYVPLPSIGVTHADAMIRNVMIVAPVGMERELELLAERLDGLQLKPEGKHETSEADSASTFANGIWLQRFRPPPGKFIAERYLGTASVWESVTPVILDGHRKAKGDDLKAVTRTTTRLICKALARAGIEAPCEFTWQMVPFFRHALSAHEHDKERRRIGYFRPEYLQGRSAVHIRLRFGRRTAEGDADSPWEEIQVAGPITIGAGRHCGFGLFAAADV